MLPSINIAWGPTAIVPKRKQDYNKVMVSCAKRQKITLFTPGCYEGCMLVVLLACAST